MGNQPLRRHSFILSLWPEAGPYPNSGLVWRISLKDARTFKRWGFKDLAALTRFLEQWMVVLPPKECEE
ncbi:MAG: hypothetical protein JXA37_04015 [Chloroflexia bacterium]|nr:hypothetical protein [Chloroflexia bacterium]